MLVLLKILPCLLLLPKLVVSYPQTTDIFVQALRNYHLLEIYRSYSACIIHVVDLIGNLELAQPTLPIIIDVWTKEAESLRNLSGQTTKFKEGIETIAQNRVKGRSTASKLLHFSCFATYILARKNSLPGSVP